MRILGIDPGIERVGIAVIEKTGGKEEFIFSECLKTSAKLTHAERLLEIGTEVKSVIKKWKPEKLSIEKLFFEKNITSAMSVAEARGICIYLAEEAGLSICEYTPMEIKVAVTGYGKSDKKGIMSMVPRLIKLPDRAMIDDEVDAIAIALTAFAYKK